MPYWLPITAEDERDGGDEVGERHLGHHLFDLEREFAFHLVAVARQGVAPVYVRLMETPPSVSKFDPVVKLDASDAR